MTTEQKDRTLTLRLPPTMLEQLRERAQAEDRTVSQVLRVAARTYLATDQHIPQLQGS